MCMRNYHGFPYNLGYKETNMTLEKIKTIVPEFVVAQLNHVLINGNFGDLVMNPETPVILSWLRKHGQQPGPGKPGLIISAFTNGGAQGREFWQALAATGVYLEFCIDGLEDLFIPTQLRHRRENSDRDNAGNDQRQTCDPEPR